MENKEKLSQMCFYPDVLNVRANRPDLLRCYEELLRRTVLISSLLSSSATSHEISSQLLRDTKQQHD